MRYNLILRKVSVASVLNKHTSHSLPHFQTVTWRSSIWTFALNHYTGLATLYPCRSLVSKENAKINPVANPKHFPLECRKKSFLTTVNPKTPPTDNQFHSSDCRQPTTHRYWNDEMITSDVCRGGPLHPREAWSDITRRLVVLPPARLKHPRPDLNLDGDVPEILRPVWSMELSGHWMLYPSLELPFCPLKGSQRSLTLGNSASTHPQTFRLQNQ